VSALVEIARFATRIRADLARLLIEDEGLTAVLFDGEVNYAFGSFMPVRLMVLREEAEQALQLLSEQDML
jgi:hypothetical protein